MILPRLLKQQKAANLYSVEHVKIDALLSKEWDVIKNIIAVLNLFYEVTLHLSISDACISIVIPQITSSMLDPKFKPKIQIQIRLYMRSAPKCQKSIKLSSQQTSRRCTDKSQWQWRINGTNNFIEIRLKRPHRRVRTDKGHIRNGGRTLPCH